MTEFYTRVDHLALLPALMLAMFGCAFLLFDTWILPDPKQRKYLPIGVIICLVLTGISLGRQQIYLTDLGTGVFTGFGGSLVSTHGPTVADQSTVAANPT